MKKYLGAIISGLLGVLTYVFLSIPQMLTKATFLGQTESNTTNAWDMIKEDPGIEIAGYGLYKFAVIALAIVAGVLIVCSIVMLLKNVLKLKFNLNIINNIVLAALAVLAVLALIALFVMGADMKELMGIIPDGAELYIGPGVGAWLNAILAVVGCAGGWIFARKAD